MSGQLVSVIIPTYNYGRYVEQAVDSALSQTYQTREVIVVDDGSKDDTRQRLTRYGSAIRYIYQENQGLSAARNTGIREAHGEYLAFLDSDDAWHPQKLAVQMKYLQDHPEVALIATEMFSTPSPLTPLPVREREEAQWCSVDMSLTPSRLITLEQMAIKPRFAPSSVLAHRRCFEVVGPFDTELRSVEDRDMWLRIGQQFIMAKIDLPLTWYRTTPGSMSTHPERMEHFELLVLRRAFESPALRNQRRVQWQALSHCYRSSAYTFHAAGRSREAAQRLFQSLWHWPWRYSRGDEVQPWYRLRLLAAAFRNMLRGQPAAKTPIPSLPSETHATTSA